MSNGSTYTILRYVVFLIPLYSYPDDDSKSDQNMLVIDMSQTMFYTRAFVGFIN